MAETYRSTEEFTSIDDTDILTGDPVKIVYDSTGMQIARLTHKEFEARYTPASNG